MMTWQSLRSEPFRLLFPLGAVFGCIGVGHWLVYGLGWSASYSGFFHASVQTGLYMPCFIVGFLLTALPRFSSAPPATTAELLAVLGLVVVQTVGVATGRWPLAEGAFAGLLLFVAVFAGRRFARRRTGASPPAEFAWLPWALGHGVAGSVLLIGGQIGGWPVWTLAVGRPLLQQGFLLGIVLGVGGFMAPRLLGQAVALTASPERAALRRHRRVALHGLAALALTGSFLLEGAGALRAAYLARAAVVTAELAWTTHWYRRPAVADGYVRLLHASLWCVVGGLWAAGLAVRYRVAALHVLFLGGFSLMTFAVGTMVVFSHSGQAERLRRPLGVLRLVGIGVAAALLARLLAAARPDAFFAWLGIAAVSWLAAGLGWLVVMLPHILRAADPDAFDAAHAAAKRRLTPGDPC